MTDFFLDDSVTMRWCFDGGNHVYADAILQRLETDSDAAAVPGLWRYEVSAVLSRAQIKGWLLATLHRLTAYDAAYLELALRRDLPIATLDVELRNACMGGRRHHCDVDLAQWASGQGCETQSGPNGDPAKWSKLSIKPAVENAGYYSSPALCDSMDRMVDRQRPRAVIRRRSERRPARSRHR